MLLRALLFGLILLGEVRAACFGQAFDKFTNAYFSDLESKHASVFVAQCFVPAAAREVKNPAEYRASLFVALNKKDGLLIESEANIIVNAATINFTKNGPRLIEANGGVYTYARIADLLEELSRGNFRLLAPFRRARLSNLRVTQRCQTKVD